MDTRIALCDASGLLTDLLQKLSGENGAAWLEKLRTMLREKKEQATAVVKNILSVVKTITIEAMVEKRTADCFTDRTRYRHRDTSLDKLLPEFQGVQPLGRVTSNQLTENSKFLGMVQSLLKTAETDPAVLSCLIIAAKQIFTLTQIEMLIERQEGGEDVGLLTNGWANFFLVLNKEGDVSVVFASRDGGQWGVYLYSLDDAFVWRAEFRFFSRN